MGPVIESNKNGQHPPAVKQQQVLAQLKAAQGLGQLEAAQGLAGDGGGGGAVVAGGAPGAAAAGASPGDGSSARHSPGRLRSRCRGRFHATLQCR